MLPRIIIFLYVRCALQSAALVAAVPSARVLKQNLAPQQHLDLGDLHQSEAALVPASRNEAPSRAHFRNVAAVASVNVLINTLRPDDGISWQMRLPRIFWEISIMAVARSASIAVSPTLYLLLSVMTGTTALLDIFIWAPLYASFSTFETCVGGWLSGQPHVCMMDYTKGLSRLLASGQSLFGGIFYLTTAIVAWHEYSTFRQEAKLKDQMAVLDALIEKHR